MHRCLNVDEIVRLIAHELVAAGRGAAAVALARCCKIFEDPTLDVLWRRQSQFIPLLKTLPEDIWGRDGCDVSMAAKTFIPSLLNCSI